LPKELGVGVVPGTANDVEVVHARNDSALNSFWAPEIDENRLECALEVSSSEDLLALELEDGLPRLKDLDGNLGRRLSEDVLGIF